MIHLFSLMNKVMFISSIINVEYFEYAVLMLMFNIEKTQQGKLMSNWLDKMGANFHSIIFIVKTGNLKV